MKITVNGFITRANRGMIMSSVFEQLETRAIEGFTLKATVFYDPVPYIYFLNECSADRIKDYENGGWCWVYVTVTCELCGVELCKASLFGIESDSGRDYFNSVANDLSADALSGAKEKLAEMKRAIAGL